MVRLGSGLSEVALQGTAYIRQQQVEDAGFLWLVRQHVIYAPNPLLRDVTRHDERIEAYVDALHIGGEAAWRETLDAVARADPSAFFTLGVLSVRIGKVDSLLTTFVETVNPSGMDSNDATPRLSADVIGSFCWSARDAVTKAISLFWRSLEAHPRAVAISAVGARRIDAGDLFPEALADQSPLVRSRAYRTTGQLGRADLMAQLRPGLADPHPECRFWSAWAAARMGAGDEALRVLADIAWNNPPRADRALDLLLRRLDIPQANAWLRDFAQLPGRQRAVIRAAGVIGDPRYIPWLIERMATLETARLAGEAFSMITGLDLAYRDLDRKPPRDFESGPNDDPADENVALDEDEHLPWPDPEKIGQWWAANRGRFDVGTPYFLGTPKPRADWLEALSDAFQRQRHAAALELAIRQPDKAMFEVRARGRLQRQLIARARGLA
jgi:uncharacterized protein (TIGR02270 family)